MPDSAALAWTFWTARLAVGAYCATVLLLAGGGTSRSISRTARGLWTLGCLLLVSHAALALKFVHHGSQAEAWAHTAKQTRAVTGLEWGGGLVINYLFLAWWSLDVAAWWMPERCRWRQRRGYQVALHAAFAFLMLNATVVFGPPWWKWVGFAMLVLLVLCRTGFARSAPEV